MQIDTTIQQIKELVDNPAIERVLVTSGTNVDPDAVGSALALASALKNAGKQVVVAIEDFDQGAMSFLPGIDQVGSAVGQKSLIISINLGTNPIEKINYNAEDSKFNLILTPATGEITADQISYSQTGLDFDAIFVVDTADPKLLGQWYITFASQISRIPVVNIDHHADNNNFGTLNVINPNYASASHVVADVIAELEQPATPDMATNLLAGLLSDTSAFMNRNTTSASLRQAADLVDGGANLAGLMQSLFRTMSVPALKLWALVLGRIETISDDIIITDVQLADIAETGASEADQDTLGNLVNGYITSVPGAKVGIVIKEKEDREVSGSLRSIDPTINVQAMARQLNGGGHILASGFRLTDITLAEARQKVLQVVQAEIQAQVSAQPTSSPIPAQQQEDAPEQPDLSAVNQAQ